MLNLNTNGSIDFFSQLGAKANKNVSTDHTQSNQNVINFEDDIKGKGTSKPSFEELVSRSSEKSDMSEKQDALYQTLVELMLKNTPSSDTKEQYSNKSYTEISNKKNEVIIDNNGSSTTETASMFKNFMESANTISFGEDGFGLDDAFDAVNILNHIPIVSDIYKDATSQDKTGAAASVAGGYMFAGPVGALFSAANVVSEELTGKSLLDNAISIGREFFGLSQSPSGEVNNHIVVDTHAKKPPVGDAINP